MKAGFVRWLTQELQKYTAQVTESILTLKGLGPIH